MFLCYFSLIARSPLHLAPLTYYFLPSRGTPARAHDTHSQADHLHVDILPPPSIPQSPCRVFALAPFCTHRAPIQLPSPPGMGLRAITA